MEGGARRPPLLPGSALHPEPQKMALELLPCSLAWLGCAKARGAVGRSPPCREPGCPVPSPCGTGQCPGAAGAAGAHQGSRTFPSPQCPSGAGLKDTQEPVVELWSRAVWPGHRDRDAPWSTCWSHVCATSIPEGLSTGLVTQGGTTAPVGVCARVTVEHRAPVPAGHHGAVGGLR